VLGYVGRINKQDMQRLDPVRYAGTHYTGKTGLERVYEDELHGDVGYQNVETNARGRVMRVLERKIRRFGRDLTINLDIRLQHIAQQAMGDKRGAIVAINPETGGILAQLSSTPGFDTNKFVTGIDHESYANLRDSLDTPCSTALPVGSIHPAPRSNPSWPLPGWIRTPSPSPAWSMTRVLPTAKQQSGVPELEAGGMVIRHCPMQSPFPATPISTTWPIIWGSR